MNINKFTESAQAAISQAQTYAGKKNHPQVEPEHLFWSAITQLEGLTEKLWTKLDVPVSEFNKALQALLDSTPTVSGPGFDADNVRFSQQTNSLLTNAERESKQMGDEYVSIEHILLAMIELKSSSKVSSLLLSYNMNRDKLLKSLSKVRGNQRISSPNPEATYDALNRYGLDLVDAAQQGKLDPVISRDEEIRRIIHILSRRTKNNPVLIGEPGVGKTAIVEGLALRIVRGDVPEGIRDKTI